ncbi:MAG: hypothetical protein AAF410_00445 [Pseudomonadota bacterium]
MKKIFSLIAVSLLTMFGFSSAVMADCEIKVCHCSGSKVESSNVALNNMDGDGIYDKKTIDRGSCKTMKGSITACFVVFKHYETNKTITTDSALASGEVAYGWLDSIDENSPYDYALSYGGKCE